MVAQSPGRRVGRCLTPCSVCRASGGRCLFLLIGEMKQLPFGPRDIVKVHRGMNMVKVSVGEHISEPSEVYITTIKDGEKLSTNVVFYLIESKIRTLYGFKGNPYESSNRINIETEAREFVEEMGAILEDIGWESMSEEDQKGWLDQQFLFPTQEELQADQPVDETVKLVEAEVDEEAILLDIEVVVPEEAPEEAPVEASKTGEPAVAAQEEVPDDILTEKPAEPEDAAQAKRQTGESLEKADKKVVFVEEKFDEMLKQAFLVPPDDTEDDEGTERDESAGSKEVEETPVKSADDGSVREERGEDARVQAESAPEGETPEGESTREARKRSDAGKILRFLSKM